MKKNVLRIVLDKRMTDEILSGEEFEWEEETENGETIKIILTKEK